VIYSSFRIPRKTGFLKKIITLLLFLILIVFLADTSLKPLVEKVAIKQAKIVSNDVVNKAIINELEKESIKYSSLVDIKKGNNGKIISIDINMLKANKLKSNISQAIQNELSSTKSKRLMVHVGAFTGAYVLDNFGPKVPITISLCGNICANFKSSFTQAGINQTKHQIYLDITADVLALVPWYPTTTGIETSMLITETIIIGDVPNIVANIGPNSDGIFSSKIN
jgi:sporulation protein YunB